MRALRLLPLLFTIALIWLLNTSFGSLPPIGKLLDPINGCWTAAEPTHKDFNLHFKIKGLQQPVSIWVEDRMVPHIRAQNNHDLYLAQGYVHAYFRLWQMDLQTRAAGGRVSEVIGKKGLDFDRGQRRKGMVYAAERSLKTMEADQRTHEMIGAYTEGINAYIQTLGYRDLPLEYKLMDFRPEPWTGLKCALLLKYMADDLTGKSDDIQYTMLRDQLGEEQFNFLFPEKIKGSKPVIPEGTKFPAATLPTPKYPGDSVWAHFKEEKSARRMVPSATIDPASPNTYASSPPSKGAGRDVTYGNQASNQQPESKTATQAYVPSPPWKGAGGDVTHSDQAANQQLKVKTDDITTGFTAATDAENHDPESGTGSNNWAISGKHTASGAPILCNDPHLGLNLPSLWFEIQLTAPGINVYGASLPGAPGVVIGFNDQISWGFTNNYRDVKDYYDITANGRETYLFNNKQVPFGKRAERIGIKGEPDVIDTVLYTIHGPVQYDATFPDPKKTGHLLAMTWMAHRPTNEVLALWLMNRATGYDAFVAGIQHFECPAQNFAYADKTGNIAMWGQGQFINKWRGQGKFVMEGRDSLTLWGQDIPMAENPHVLNPPQGYVASANQNVTDSTYPYWYNGDFVEFRSWRINEILAVNFPTHTDSVIGYDGYNLYGHISSMQTDEHSYLQKKLGNFWDQYLDFQAKRKIGSILGQYKGCCLSGPFNLDANEFDGSIKQILWSQLYEDIWQDEFPNSTLYPSTERTMQLLLSDSSSRYYDDRTTRQVESLRTIVQRAFKETTDSLDKLKATTGLEWYKVKNTSLTHLAKIPAFSYTQLKTGGSGNTINAMKQNHGPSWRMIVEMDEHIKAYGVYPGGQSGNPGSRHYSDFIDYWVAGNYYELKFLAANTVKNPFAYTWTMVP